MPIFESGTTIIENSTIFIVIFFSFFPSMKFEGENRMKSHY